jgi:hypothetical protein
MFGLKITNKVKIKNIERKLILALEGTEKKKTRKSKTTSLEKNTS